MTTLTMNMVQTTGFAIVVLLIGTFVRKRVRSSRATASRPR